MIAAPLSLYIHWPYCARICPYCDFNVFKAKSESGDDLTAAIIKDLSHWRSLSGPRQIVSVHFGGGTPSLMRPDQISDILSAAKKLWSFDADVEIALEANPADADVAKWESFHAAGVSRLSLGIQSFDDAALKLLGRDHNGAQAKTALMLATQIFPRVSADLIFGHKGQSFHGLADDLDMLIQSEVGHISAYQLTIETATAFGRAKRRGKNMAVSSDESADFYDQVKAALTVAGYDAYEVSNYAKMGQESRHNMAYWTGADYAGLGPGAHGRLTTPKGRLATIAQLSPAAYINSITETGQALTENALLSPQDHAAEYVMMGLRIVAGISLRKLRGINPAALNVDSVADMQQMGMLIHEGDRLYATPDGRCVLDSVTGAILA